jgi:hypothetical protein
MANANPASKAEEPTTEVQVADAPVGPTKSKKAEKQSGPKVEFYGEGAEEVKFEIDPKAVLVRVYGSGVVLTDY